MVMCLPADETAGEWLMPAQVEDLMQRQQAEQAQARERQELLGQVQAEVAQQLAAAEAAATDMLERARAEAQLLREQALQEAQTEAARQWQRQREAQARTLATWEHSLANLVCSLVERLVGEQPTSVLFPRALALVQDELRGATRLRLRVAASDEAAAREALAALPLADGATVVIDARLKPGDCLAESDLGWIDVGLASQLQALRDWLNEGNATPLTSSPTAPEAAPEAPGAAQTGSAEVGS